MNKAPIILYNYETFYVCDKKKECFGSPICGKQCRYTKDKNHMLIGTLPVRKMAAPEIYRR